MTASPSRSRIPRRRHARSRVALRALLLPALLATSAACSDDSTGPGPRELEPLIAFSHEVAGSEAQVAVMKPDGTELRGITPGAHGDYSPAWHPSGESLVFSSRRDAVSKLYVVGLEAGGPGVHFPTGDLHAWEGAWSPQGDAMAVGTAGGILIVEPGIGARQLVSDADDPAWAPDGEWIAFTALGDTEEPGLRRRQLFIVRRDGSDTTRIARSVDTPIHDPTWSPDGSRIVFEAGGVGGRGDLYGVVLATDQVQPLTETEADERHPDWSPDGERIAYSSAATVAGDRHVWTMKADGTDRRQLTTIPGQHSSPRWRPGAGGLPHARR